MRSALIRNGLPAIVASLAGFTALPSPSVAQASEPLFGFGDSSAIYRYPGAPTSQRLAGLQARAGAEVARFTIHWGVVQPKRPPRVGPPHYRWARYDRFVAALRERGIRPLPVLLGAPGWARSDEGRCRRQICPPRSGRLAEWRAFVAAVAARYRAAPAIEIWNEPNLRYFWSLPGGPDPARYARLYAAGRAAARRVDPGVEVLTGGLSPVVRGGRRQRAVGPFIRRLGEELEGSLRRPGSAIGLHLYPDIEERSALRPGGRFAVALAQALRVRDEVAPGREIWVTEFGASTTAHRGGSRTAAEARQSGLIAAMLAELRAAEGVAATIAYTVVDRPRGKPRIEEGYGLLRRGPGFRPKRSYCLLARVHGRPAPGGCGAR